MGHPQVGYKQASLEIAGGMSGEKGHGAHHWWGRQAETPRLASSKGKQCPALWVQKLVGELACCYC